MSSHNESNVSRGDRVLRVKNKISIRSETVAWVHGVRDRPTMRVNAPVDLSDTRTMWLRTAMAADPINKQYRQASVGNLPERIGAFAAWDPEHGAWPLSIQQRRILCEVSKYTSPEWIEKVLLPSLDMTDERVEPSLRLIDWFVTNYSKSHGISLNGMGVHEDYVEVRKAYQCRHFDPFRRNLKVTCFAPDGTQHHTTVGQLNFLVWADCLGVLQYVREQREDISTDMHQICRKTRKHRKFCRDADVTHKRAALSKHRHVLCRVTRYAPTSQ